MRILGGIHMVKNRYSTPHLDEFITRQITAWKGKPEQRILSKIWTEFNKAGNPIKFVDDTEEINPVDNREEFFYQVYNLDEFFLLTATGQWVRIVMGNDWDCVVDYVLSLEATMTDINEFVEDHAY
jgi:hypothetical protein